MTNGTGRTPISSESEEELLDETNALINSATLSGASGQFLKEELAKLLGQSRLSRHREETRHREDRSQERAAAFSFASTCSFTSSWAHVEHGVAVVYDRPLSGFFNFFYDVLQFSSGRDKFCAFVQGSAKFASAALSTPGSERHFMFRAVEDCLSDGRKIFRLFKEFREVYKVRRGINRLLEGVSQEGVLSIPAVCGALDTLGHTASFFYFLFDNLLWSASVGILRSKEVPKWQTPMWQGARQNGVVIAALGGLSNIKWRKNIASLWRVHFSFMANVLLLWRATLLCAARGGAFQGPDDPRLFHLQELFGMAAHYQILLSRLGYARISQKRLGLLAMFASACGIWTNWRKVVRKRCGTKAFPPWMDRRRLDFDLR